ncbi:MAG: ThuA domain-containing protein [Fimbriimonas sp.]
MVLVAAMVALGWQGPVSVTFEGKRGPGRGQRIVLLAGDEEYRSEEALTQLGKILAERHGFTCDVVYPIAKDGTIDPEVVDNLPGISKLAKADLVICMLRFRNLPDEQMQFFGDYMKSGRPIIGFRTATHAFQVPAGRKFAAYDWQSKDWPGGFGRQVLGETWVAHHGQHLVQSTRTVTAPTGVGSPILNGVNPIWVPSDVYEATPPADSKILLFGAVLANMSPTATPVAGPQNNPMRPVAWTRSVKVGPKPTTVFTTTLGSSLDFQDENLRRLTVNACYWTLGKKVPARADVALVGSYQPSAIGFSKHRRGVRPGEF